MSKFGTVAFITTPKFREFHLAALEDFIYSHLYELCDPFSVLTTAQTGKFILSLIDREPNDLEREKIRASMTLQEFNEHDIERWRRTIRQSMTIMMERFQGMIQVTYELVEGRLDAVIHFTHWQDKNAKPDASVLSREANVHNVPIATDPHTAVAYIRQWKHRLTDTSVGGRVFVPRRRAMPGPLDTLTQTDRVLAIVAHDNMKLETCLFAVEHARHIFQNYDYILATGTTGYWLKRYMYAVGRGQSEVERVLCCNSGPKGGDIQIAYAVIRRICHKIIFLQDPTISHAHDSDIRLFEQAVLAKDVHVALATNTESARLLVGA